MLHGIRLQEGKTDGKSCDISYQIIIIPHHVEPCTLLSNQSTVDACTFEVGKHIALLSVRSKQAPHRRGYQASERSMAVVPEGSQHVGRRSCLVELCLAPYFMKSAM